MHAVPQIHCRSGNYCIDSFAFKIFACLKFINCPSDENQEHVARLTVIVILKATLGHRLYILNGLCSWNSWRDPVMQTFRSSLEKFALLETLGPAILKGPKKATYCFHFISYPQPFLLFPILTLPCFCVVFILYIFPNKVYYNFYMECVQFYVSRRRLTRSKCL